MNEPNQQTSDTPSVSPYAGKHLSPDMLVNVSRLVTAYYCNTPDPGIAAQRVAFGTSGHRGSSFLTTFNEAHILAICQAICRYRQRHGIALQVRYLSASIRTPCPSRPLRRPCRFSRATAST